MKDLRSQGGGLFSTDIFRTRGFLQIRTSALLLQKTSDFLKFLVSPHGQGRGVNFSPFCADVFYVRSLTLNSKKKIFHEAVCAYNPTSERKCTARQFDFQSKQDKTI